MPIFTDEKKCQQNHRCSVVKACPVGAISQNGKSAPVVSIEKCIICRKCLARCPHNVFVFNDQ